MCPQKEWVTHYYHFCQTCKVGTERREFCRVKGRTPENAKRHRRKETFVATILDPGNPSEGGSTPSQNGKPGEPSLLGLQRISDVLADVPGAGLVQVPVLTGPLIITGPGSPDSGGHSHGLVSSRSKKLGEEGFIFTLYLDHATLASLEKHCGEAGGSAMAGVSFGVSIETLEQSTT